LVRGVQALSRRRASKKINYEAIKAFDDDDKTSNGVGACR
jgi:hypothetical protein